MLEVSNKRKLEWNQQCPSGSSKIRSSQEMETQIQQEVELAEMYCKDGTLIHPHNDTIRMNLLIIANTNLDKTIEFTDPQNSAKGEYNNCYAYNEMIASRYSYVPVEEDM
jgi:hypothetical protein